ncbi:hypothetical protein M8494_30845 [Serratia ureilytica]
MGVPGAAVTATGQAVRVFCSKVCIAPSSSAPLHFPRAVNESANLIDTAKLRPRTKNKFFKTIYLKLFFL